MKTPREIFKAAIRKNGLTRRDIAACSGISVRSLENILSGAPSRLARQRITNLCGGVTLWEDMPPTERLFILNSNVEINFLDCADGEARAKETAAELGDSVIRSASVIRFLRSVAFRTARATSRPSLSQSRFRS